MKKVPCYDCSEEIEVKEMARKPFNWVCPSCKAVRLKNSITRYHERHPDRTNLLARQRYDANPSKFKERAINHLHNLSPTTREQVRSYNREYHRINREQRQLYSTEYYKLPHAKIMRTFRARQAGLIRRGLMCKNVHTESLNGCSWEQLKQHLEQQFNEGMTWDNYGSVWHIDHIIPIASFNLTVKEEQVKCFHYTNLQPLFAKDNLTKGSRV